MSNLKKREASNEEADLPSDHQKRQKTSSDAKIEEKMQDGTQSQKGFIHKIDLGEEKPKTGKKWEKRWILVPNVYQFGQDVWVHKWVNLEALDQDQNANTLKMLPDENQNDQ